MLQTYTFTAGLARSASTIPSISRLGRIDVYSDPGPTMISSAARIACLGFGVDLGVGGLEEHAVDVVDPVGHLRFADTDLAPRGGAEDDVAQRRRDDLTTHREDPAGLADGVLEVAGDLRHGGDEEVAERVAGERSLAAEAVLEELGHQRLGLGERGQALADVPGGSTRYSSRSRPLEPPSSATVTIATMLPVYFFTPRSSADSPVPPPIATRRGPLASERYL